MEYCVQVGMPSQTSTTSLLKPRQMGTDKVIVTLSLLNYALTRAPLPQPVAAVASTSGFQAP